MEELKCAFKGFPITRDEAVAMFMKTSFYDPQKKYVVQCVSNDVRCYTTVPRSIEPFFIIKEQPQHHQYTREDGMTIHIRMDDMGVYPVSEDGSGYGGGREGEENDVYYYGVSGFVVKSCNLYDLSVMRLTECISFINKVIGSKSRESMGYYELSDDVDNVFNDEEEEEKENKQE